MSRDLWGYGWRIAAPQENIVHRMVGWDLPRVWQMRGHTPESLTKRLSNDPHGVANDVLSYLEDSSYHGIGHHFTRDPNFADYIADIKGDMHQFHVVFSGTHDPDDVDHNSPIWDEAEAWHEEQETPLVPGAAVHLHQMKIRPSHSSDWTVIPLDRITHTSWDGSRTAQIILHAKGWDLENRAEDEKYNSVPPGYRYHFAPELDSSFLVPEDDPRSIQEHIRDRSWASGLRWHSGEYGSRPGELAQITTKNDHQGQGLATILFNLTSRDNPDLHHSEHMTSDGRAWAKEMYGWNPPEPDDDDDYHTAARLAMPSEDYQGQHRPGGPDHGAPFHDLNQMWGDDIYEHPEWYDSMDYGIKNIQRQLNEARGNPDHPVVIYRAIPSGKTDINTGDWITTSLPYAREHAVQSENPDEDWPIVRSTVPAKHVWTNNDLHEWGYHGPNVRGEIVNSNINQKKAHIMTAAVTVYTKPNCPQCTMTKKQLDRLGIEHQTIDVTADPEAHAYVTGLGYQQAPVVVVGDGERHWGGFRPDHLKGLVE